MPSEEVAVKCRPRKKRPTLTGVALKCLKPADVTFKVRDRDGLYFTVAPFQVSRLMKFLLKRLPPAPGGLGARHARKCCTNLNDS